MGRGGHRILWRECQILSILSPHSKSPCPSLPPSLHPSNPPPISPPPQAPPPPSCHPSFLSEFSSSSSFTPPWLFPSILASHRPPRQPSGLPVGHQTTSCPHQTVQLLPLDIPVAHLDLPVAHRISHWATTPPIYPHQTFRLSLVAPQVSQSPTRASSHIPRTFHPTPSTSLPSCTLGTHISLPRAPCPDGGSLVSPSVVVAVTVGCHFLCAQAWAGKAHARGRRQENHRERRAHAVGDVGLSLVPWDGGMTGVVPLPRGGETLQGLPQEEGVWLLHHVAVGVR